MTAHSSKECENAQLSERQNVSLSITYAAENYYIPWYSLYEFLRKNCQVSCCYGLYPDVPPKPQVLTDGASERWLDQEHVMLD